MTRVVAEAKALLEKEKELPLEAFRELLSTFSEDVRHTYHDLKKASYFIPENADVSRRREHLSPSGKYKLVVTPFTTGPKSWCYTQGLVYRVGSDEPLAEVQRNYSAFPFCFVEGHPKGSFLVAGKDYQGQTVIELSTGQRRELLPEEAKKGHGFCWASYEWVPSMQALLVSGCYWACPYEYRFYDFSDPMNGWPQIGEEVCIDDDQRRPELRPDGTIKVFQTQYPDDDEEGSDNEGDNELEPVAAYTVYRREGLTLIEIEAWVSDKEQERRRKNKEANDRFEKWWADFKTTDPLYLALLEGVKDTSFNPSDYNSIGQTFKDWCPNFDKTERKVCRRIHNRTGKQGHTIDLEWGVDTGPIKLVIYKDGKKTEDKFFMEHSVEAMQQAFAYSKAIVGGAP